METSPRAAAHRARVSDLEVFRLRQLQFWGWVKGISTHYELKAPQMGAARHEELKPSLGS